MASIIPDKGKLEKRLASGGLVAGVDEVGRGCLAGPVYAAAVVLDLEKLSHLSMAELSLMRDSKSLSKIQRQRILPIIEEIAISSSIGQASVREIERLGISAATFLAMHRAIASLQVEYHILLIDGKMPLPDYNGRQASIVKGDNLCYSIACASILAKEARDGYMLKQSIRYPSYGFESHVGYGTKRHLDSIKENGICPLHRRNFSPISSMI
ncbi:MAG: ribonuclease HII [Bdellovibrionota bacterium]